MSENFCELIRKNKTDFSWPNEWKCFKINDVVTKETKKYGVHIPYMYPLMFIYLYQFWTFNLFPNASQSNRYAGWTNWTYFISLYPCPQPEAQAKVMPRQSNPHEEGKHFPDVQSFMRWCFSPIIWRRVDLLSGIFFILFLVSMDNHRQGETNHTHNITPPLTHYRNSK